MRLSDYILTIMLLLSFCANNMAQERKVYIRDIKLEGNDKTKPFVVLGRMDIEAGDSILLSDLWPAIERNTRYVKNTYLFTEYNFILEMALRRK